MYPPIEICLDKTRPLHSLQVFKIDEILRPGGRANGPWRAPGRAEVVFEATAPRPPGEQRDQAPRDPPAQSQGVPLSGRKLHGLRQGRQQPGTRPDGFFDRGAEAADKRLEREGHAGAGRIRRVVEG